MFKSESSLRPIKKHPTMQPGIIRKNAIGNLIKNSAQPVFVFCSFFSIVTIPSPVFQRQQ